MKVSVVSDHRQTTNIQATELATVLNAIKNGGKTKDTILKIREMVSKGINGTELKDVKAKLPAVLFGGTFSERKNDGLKQGSGLMILDFDKVESGFDAALKQNNFIYAVWLSPSGNGYKALIRIPEVKNDAEYKSYFYSIQQQLTNVDPSGKDVARLCYFSYDPDLYLNENAEVWTKRIDIKKSAVAYNPKIKNGNSNSRCIALIAKIINESVVGKRHDAMLRAGRLAGGYIAGGEIDEYETIITFQTQIEYHSPDDYKDHIRAFMDGINNGKSEPLTQEEIRQIAVEERFGKIHYTIDEVADELDEVYQHGYDSGYYLGWKDVDDRYSLHLGSTTYIYSAPFSGKSQWWMECLINLSMFYGMRHALFSPETGTATEVFIELMQIYTRKNYTGEYKMPESERRIAKAFIRDHFVVIDADSFDVDLTVKDVCEYVDFLERKFNQKIHTLTIDPFNELKHDYGEQSRDIYLELALKYIRRNAKKNKRHICVVTHVRDQFPIHNKEKGYTYFPMATYREVAGGQTWSRKGMMMISLWRPVVSGSSEIFEVEIENKTYKSNQLVVAVQKAKPKGRGRPGEANLYYDWRRHCFTDDYHQEASKKETRAESLQSKLIPERDEPTENIPW